MLDFSPLHRGMGMYDLRVLRDNLDGLRERLGPRGKDVAWEDLRKLTEDRRTRMIQVEELRHQLKKVRTRSLA